VSQGNNSKVIHHLTENLAVFLVIFAVQGEFLPITIFFKGLCQVHFIYSLGNSTVQDEVCLCKLVLRAINKSEIVLDIETSSSSTHDSQKILLAICVTAHILANRQHLLADLNWN
jgi:hypothetical protein